MSWLLFFVAVGALVILVPQFRDLAATMRKPDPCVHCGKQAGFRWRYARMDGGPDGRYHSNDLICRACGESKSKPPTGVVSCSYVIQAGPRRFADCPNYPPPGQKCRVCWVRNDTRRPEITG